MIKEHDEVIKEGEIFRGIVGYQSHEKYSFFKKVSGGYRVIWGQDSDQRIYHYRSVVVNENFLRKFLKRAGKTL